MVYRILQLTHALFPQIKYKDIQWALKYLSPEASTLFLQQALPDQRHAIDVTQSILKASRNISTDDLKNLIVAALLHDCGKSVIFIPLWQRVFIVLIHKAPQSLQSCLVSRRSIFSLPIKLDERHTLWGSYLAEQAGLNPVICQLIREHHSPKTDLGHLLEQADNHH